MLVGSESEVQEISIAATHFGHPDSIDIAFFDIKGQMTEEMIMRYSEGHCEQKATDGFQNGTWFNMLFAYPDFQSVIPTHRF